MVIPYFERPRLCQFLIIRFFRRILSVLFIMVIAIAAFVMIEVQQDAEPKNQYETYTTREEFIDKEELLSVGGSSDLNPQEIIVNKCLMRHKLHELNYAFKHPHKYLFNQHYFHYKDKIKDSKVYQIIKAMPKGAVLHIHDMSILGPDYLMQLTYLDYLYILYKKDRILYKFAKQNPSDKDNNWMLLSDLRKETSNTEQFDATLRKHFTLVTTRPDERAPSISHTWEAFTNFFTTVESLLTYRPVWTQYFYDALKEFKKQNILYVEVRTTLPKLYDLEGNQFSSLVTAKCYHDAIKEFSKDYPDFMGAKLIYGPLRYTDSENLEKHLKIAQIIQAEMPQYFAGFDLVGQEDLGGTLSEHYPVLSQVQNMNFYFHAGETNWYGFPTDENLYDAILLKAKRLGHAFALPKHPLMMKEVIERNICVEVNVISNIVLSLARDVRNHPLSVLLAHGVPVVLSSDNPGVWEADLLTDDFYVAFVGAAHKYADLRLLKTLVLNSITYSAMTDLEKKAALSMFEIQWDFFINNFDCKKYFNANTSKRVVSSYQ